MWDPENLVTLCKACHMKQHPGWAAREARARGIYPVMAPRRPAEPSRGTGSWDGILIGGFCLVGAPLLIAAFVLLSGLWM